MFGISLFSPIKNFLNPEDRSKLHSILCSGSKKKKFGDISFKVLDEPIISQNSLKFLLAENTKWLPLSILIFVFLS